MNAENRYDVIVVGAGPAGSSAAMAGGAEAGNEHPAAGYVVDRKIFDRDLAGLAAKEGAVVKTGTPAVGLLNGKGGPIRGVKVLEEGKTHEYFAPVIIASDGIESRIGFWAGLK